LDEQNGSFGPHSATEVPGFTPDLLSASRMGVGQIRTLAEANCIVVFVPIHKLPKFPSSFCLLLRPFKNAFSS
jgi:hypothetical protein